MQSVAWILLAPALALVVVTHWQLRALRPSFLATQFAWSRAGFDGIVARWSARQRAAYRLWQRADFVTLACYGAFGWLWAGAAGHAPWLVGMLPAAAMADALENVLHLRFTRPGAAPAPDALHRAAGFASALKFMLIAGFVVALALAP